MTYGLNDICLLPSVVSKIEHRSECDPYNIDDMLPLFTAPMNSVINENNYEQFIKNKINTIIPRGVKYKTRWKLSTKTFVALGLEEFEDFIKAYNKIFDTDDDVRYICVDIANGHMKKLIDICNTAKSSFGERIVIMAGNIANPQTYIEYAKVGIDFVRIGIGNGSVCTTSANIGVHYAMASLIKEVTNKKHEVEQVVRRSALLNVNNCFYKSIPYIIADGGFDSYDKIIKALALGADYVMVGKLFAQCHEACGEKYSVWDGEKYNVYRKYYGMSTKRAQFETGNKILKTAEGIEVSTPIIYKLSSWCDNFISYLRSAMSYTDSPSLSEFKKTKYTIVSFSEYSSFYK